MNNLKILTDFFNGDEEFIINEKILDDINYVAPTYRILDYIKKLLNIPYSEFIDFIQTWSFPSITSDSITQSSSFSAAEIEMCEVLIANNNLGFSYDEIGSLFPQYCTSKTPVALKKYGENQVKTAKQLGLTFQYYGKWYLNCFGYVYKMLSSSERKSLIARTLLRDALYGTMMRDITRHDISLEDYLYELSESTIKRRSSGIIRIFEIAHEEALNSNIQLFNFNSKNKDSIDIDSVHECINYSKIMDNNNLTELYALRDSLIKYNAPIPSEIMEQISIAEKSVLTDSAKELLRNFPTELDKLSDCSCLIAVQYDNGKLSKSVIDFNSDLENLFQNVEIYDCDHTDDEELAFSTPKSLTTVRKRSKSVGFSVHFADGHIVSENSAVKTMIEAFRYIGLDRVAEYNEDFAGFSLVDKNKRNDSGHKWQEYVDGWWVYINLSNNRKIACLKGISKMLNIPLAIVLDNNSESSNSSQLESKEHKGKRTMYSLNGGVPTSKNKSVFNTIQLFMKEMPNASYDEILAYFPKELQGSYSVLQTMEQIKTRINKGQDTEKRYFLDQNEILTSADGVQFVVCTQWGSDNFPVFQKHIAENLGWTLEEVE